MCFAFPVKRLKRSLDSLTKEIKHRAEHRRSSQVGTKRERKERSMRLIIFAGILGLVLGSAFWAVAEAADGAASTYSNLCASCHGPKGQGNGPAAAALNPKPKNFADCKVMKKIPDETLFKVIKGGGQSVGLSPMMPPWGGSLTDKQIHSMVEYVRSFCKK